MPGGQWQSVTFIDLDNGDAIMLAEYGVAVSTWDWTGAFGGVNFKCMTQVCLIY